MKRLTIDQTWEQCLAMWKWVSKQCGDNYDCDSVECQDGVDCRDCPYNSPVNSLKEKWLEDNNYQDIFQDCFFCDLTEDENGNGNCRECQLRIEGVSFSCTEEGQNYEYNPKSFYAKLKELNKIRLERKKK